MSKLAHVMNSKLMQNIETLPFSKSDYIKNFDWHFQIKAIYLGYCNSTIRIPLL